LFFLFASILEVEGFVSSSDGSGEDVAALRFLVLNCTEAAELDAETILLSLTSFPSPDAPALCLLHEMLLSGGCEEGITDALPWLAASWVKQTQALYHETERLHV
jgi:hypothetical protein